MCGRLAARNHVPQVRARKKGVEAEKLLEGDPVARAERARALAETEKASAPQYGLLVRHHPATEWKSYLCMRC